MRLRLRKKTKKIRRRKEKRKDGAICEKCEINCARTGCRLCVACFKEDAGDKQEDLVICQGCPSWVPKGTQDDIKWKRGDPGMARWLVVHFEIEERKSSSNTSAKWLQVEGWKDARGTTDVPRQLDGELMIPLLREMADDSGFNSSVDELGSTHTL